MKKRLIAGLVVMALLMFALPLLTELNTRADDSLLALDTGDTLYIELLGGGTYRATHTHRLKASVITGSCEKPLRLTRAEGAGAAALLAVEAPSGGADALTLRLEGIDFSGGVRIGTQSQNKTNVRLILQRGTANSASGAPGSAGIAVGENASLTFAADAQGKGTLLASGAEGGAGVGGDAGRACGAITVLGGRITARGAEGGAGLGGGSGASGGAISIGGGTVLAVGAGGGASVGNGFGGGAASSENYVQITGGSLFADEGISPAPRTGAGPKKGDAVRPVLLDVTQLTGAAEGVPIDALRFGSAVDAEGRSDYGADDLFTVLSGGHAQLCAYLPVLRCAGFVKAGGAWRQLYITHDGGLLSGRLSAEDTAEIDLGYDNAYFAEDAGGACCVRYGGREFASDHPAYGKVTQTPFPEDGNRHSVSNRRMLVLGGKHTVTVVDAALSDSVSGLNLASKRAGIDVRGGALTLIVSDTLSVIARNSSDEPSVSHAGIRVSGDAKLSLYCAAAWNGGAPSHAHVCEGACASVQAAGGAGAAGIGVSEGGTLEVHGCRVSATGGAGGAGVGGGEGVSCGSVRVLGGRLVAAGGSGASGIGAGAGAYCGRISLLGGTIVATPGEGAAAGIGDASYGGAAAEGRFVRITGGSIYSANGHIYPAPRSEEGTGGAALSLVTLSFAGVESVSRVRALEMDISGYSYNMRSATTDEKGRAFVYLPAEMCVLSALVAPNAAHETRWYPAYGAQIRACADASTGGTLYAPLAGTAKVSGEAFVGGTLTASFEAAEANADAALYYAWYRMDSAQGTLVQAPSRSAASYSPVPQDLGYALVLRVSAENYGYRIESDKTSNVFTVPGAPVVTGVKTSGTGAITVRWEAPVVSGGGAITAYKVYRGEELLTSVALSSEARSYTDPDCASGGYYGYCVSAVNAAGEGEKSALMSCEMAHAPSAPRNITASANLGNGSVMVSWRASEQDGGAMVRSYRVLYRPAGSSAAFESIDTPAIAGQLDYSYLIAPGALLNGGNYEFRVEAVNLAGAAQSESAAAMPYLDPVVELGEDKTIEAAFRFGEGERAVAYDTLQLKTKVGTVARTFPYGAFRISDNPNLSYSMPGVRVSGITSIHQGEVLLSVELEKSVSVPEGYLWYEYTLGNGAIRRLHVGTVYFDKTVDAAGTGNAITSFVLAAQEASGTISGDSIRLVVPAGTDVTALTPDIRCSSYARCRPRTGIAQDFSSPVTYTVTAQDGGVRRYTVTVEEARTAIAVSTETVDFGTLPFGYELPAAAEVAVRNVGNQATAVSLSGETLFTLGALSGETLRPLGEVRFAVQPPEGLTPGVYEETLTLMGENGASARLVLRMTVSSEAAVPAQAAESEASALLVTEQPARNDAETAPAGAERPGMPVWLLVSIGVTAAALAGVVILRARFAARARRGKRRS